MLIGIDDTDSIQRGCTTYLASLLCRELKIKNPPRLVRLNPNIPYKTRGNGAVLLEAELNGISPDHIIDFVRDNSQLEYDGTDPGIVFLDKVNGSDKKRLSEYYQSVLSEHVSIDHAMSVAEAVKAETHFFKEGRGVVGALAAVGSFFGDRTYELIAYRSEKNHGLRRMISSQSVMRMNEAFYPKTFDNLDDETGFIKIAPRGYDPVLCGIRGETSEVVLEAWNMIEPHEDVQFFQIFETNQATDCHILPKKISEVRPYDCVRLSGVVVRAPRRIAGGHVIFTLDDGTGTIDCAAYKPTGSFRNLVGALDVGDEIEVCGGLSKYVETVNLEKLLLKKMSDLVAKSAPLCCGKSMTSAGRGKGFKCRVCGGRSHDVVSKNVERRLLLGWYEVPPRARRHLSKPLVRN